MAHVLVAEHNASSAEYIYNALKKAGNTVTVAENSLNAWRATQDQNYDVLLVDVVMPGIDGFVLAQKAIQENPGIQVIFITGFAAVAMDTYNTPAYAPAPVTSRPFHLKDVVKRVRYLTGESFMLDETDMQGRANAQTDENNVIYADFTHKGHSPQPTTGTTA